MDLRLYGNELVGKKFKTTVNVTGWHDKNHVWHKSREFVIDEVFEHHVLCSHVCEDSAQTYKESFNTADLIQFGILKGKG